MGPSASALAAFAAALVTAFGSCFAELRTRIETEAPVFVAPAPGQLSEVGAVSAVLTAPPQMVPDSLVVTLDGADVTSAFTAGPGPRFEASLEVAATGPHALVARLRVAAGAGEEEREARVDFHTIAMHAAAGCELLNALDCLLPYPSSRFLAPADTPTGHRIELPADGMPTFFNVDAGRSVRLSPEPFRVLDGFSPAVQVLMHVPGGVDVAASGASRLLPETRSYDLSSLEPDHPTLLLDADTGERVLHFLETDARAVDLAGDPLPDQLLFLRPAVHLRPGHRYVVAVRRLVHPDGSPVQPEPVFRALRDGARTTIPAVEAERARMARIFDDLRAAGLSEAELGELVLAFDFEIASLENTTGEMLSMRDQALAWLAAQPGPTFTVDEARSEEHDCDVPDQFVWRFVHGTFQVPLFLSSDPAATPGQLGFLQHDADGTPLATGTTDAPFSVVIPCAARTADGEPVRPLVVGHGLGMTGRSMLEAVVGEGAALGIGEALEYVLGATDWHGLSGPDFEGVIQLQGFLGGVFRDFDQFAALPDRLRQAQTNTVVLARMLRDGAFNASPWFQRADGSGVLPGRSEPAHYFGVSLGGILGTMFAALTPDVERLNVDVGASNFSLLLSRATPFREFEDLLLAVSQPNVTVQALGIQLLQELWTRGEPAGYARTVTGLVDPPLPGSVPKRILMTVARFDHQVSNQASEILARTLGIPSLVGSAEPGKPLIPDEEGPLDSALVYYDAGGLVPGVHDLDIPPLTNRRVARGQCDPHSERLATPASLDQLAAFLQPDGRVLNFCDGLCDGRDALGDPLPYEIPFGDPAPCVPSTP